MKKALLVIDVQNDYFPNGKFELYKANKCLINIQKLVESFRSNHEKVIFVQHISSKDGVFFVPGTTGVELHKDLNVKEKDIIVRKNYPNSFLKTNLKELLDNENIEELYVCGMMTHMCVDTTVRAAFDLGYKVKLFSDACTTRDLKFKKKILKAQDVNDIYMASLNGMFASVISTENL